MHLCRLRHFAEGRWSAAFFAYSSERYEACLFASGEMFGGAEAGFDVGAIYLREPQVQPRPPSRAGRSTTSSRVRGR